MYAVPSQTPSSSATRKPGGDSTYASNTAAAAKPPSSSSKIVQYQRDRSAQTGGSGGMQSLGSNGSLDASMGSVNTSSTTTTPALQQHLAPGARQESGGNVWNSSAARLFAQSKSQQQQQQQQQVLDDAGGPSQHEAKQSNGPAALASPTHTGEHPLQHAWSFWFMHRAPGHKIDDYEAAMTRIATFATAESFWAAYSHLRRADSVPTITDYHLFRAGVRPMWEDPENVAGGKWMIRLKKGVSPRMWERLAVAIVGGAFNDSDDDGDNSAVCDEVCGIVISIRNSEDIISLWNKTATDHRTNARIRDSMKHVMHLPSDCVIQYKAHNDSLRDNTSSNFRTSDTNTK
ncbi:hypothetical protein H4217_006872 [Coemansia sp. RSA 1939]|nr:hypothetical protein H4217_006872 [Coemansia sp. RSA 1939]KAJ2602745.1 hypothetical protein EV177_006773 [Coemansia sp. RSA 1804]